MRVPSATLACVALVTAPASGLAVEGSDAPERAAIERSQRIGTGLLWGAVATAGAGGLTLLGLIPTQRNLRAAEARRSLCEVACSEHDADIERWTGARNAVAVTGSILAVGGLALVAVGVRDELLSRHNS